MIVSIVAVAVEHALKHQLCDQLLRKVHIPREQDVAHNGFVNRPRARKGRYTSGPSYSTSVATSKLILRIGVHWMAIGSQDW